MKSFPLVARCYPAFLAAALLSAGCEGASGDDVGLDTQAGTPGGSTGASGAGGLAGQGGSGVSGSSGQAGSSAAGQAGAAGQQAGGEAGAAGEAGQGGTSPAGAGGEAGASGDAGAGGDAGSGMSGSSGQSGSGGSGGGGGGGAGGSGGSGGSGGAAGSGGSGGAGGSGGSGAAAGSGGSGAAAGNGGATSCGDGEKNGEEQCDGDALGGQTCATALDPTMGGQLKCKANCQFDFDGCAKNPVCGDGAINTDSEECDDSDFKGLTCAKVLNTPAATGVLSCTGACKLDTSGCKQGPTCGDGTVDPGEECDGADTGKATCASVTGNPDAGGQLGCTAGCKLDSSKCVLDASCGDGVVNDAGEQCDGSDVPGDCKSALGNLKATGTVKCGSHCKYDVTGCTIPSFCGDGKRDASEDCDGQDFGASTCESWLGQGYTGQLACSNACKVSTAGCTKVAYCGDKLKNGVEQCDGGDLAGASCASVVGTGSQGKLTCKADCTYEVAACSVPPTCGNGKLDPGEQCEGANLNGQTCAVILQNPKATGAVTCSSSCTIESACTIPPYCGDGKLNGAEECDDGNASNGDGCEACKVVCLGSEKKFGTNCYVDSWYLAEAESQKSWDAAEAYCVAGGGHLVSIASNAEYQFVYNDVVDSFASGQRWVGFNDKVTEGSFAWSSGEPVVIVPPWRAGEPNNAGGNEDCVELRWADAEWSDNSCSKSQMFICEYPPPVLFP